MRGKHRRRRGHHRGATFAGITLIAAASAIIISAVAGGASSPRKVPSPLWTAPSLSPITRAAQRCTPIILRDEPIGDAPAPRISQERGEAGAGNPKVAQRPAIPVPAPAGGFTEDLSSAAHSYLAQNAVTMQRAATRQDLVNRINGYLAGSPMVGLAECMVANAERYGYNPVTGDGPDPRLCAAVAQAESSLGLSPRAQHNLDLFGMGGSYASWESNICAWFDNLVSHPSWAPWQTGYDIQRPPAYCETNQAEYAANVTRVVEAI